jgi:hypothetical protein
MPPATTSDQFRTKRWLQRLESANKAYEAWAKKFSVNLLQEYWEGFQWQGLTEAEAEKKYVINLVYGSIETTLPSLLFFRPKYKVNPKPSRLDDAMTTAEEQAQVCQDAIQTVVDDPDIHFDMATKLAVFESFFRFGVVEVGYTADWIDNPNAGKPVLREDSEEPLKDKEGKDVLQPERMLQGEQSFIKRIPATAFRVSMSSCNNLEDNDWVAYSEWHYVADVQANKDYTNTSLLKPTGVIRDEYRDAQKSEVETRHGMVRLWKIWDTRKKVKHVMAEGHNRFLMKDKPYEVFPFAVLKFHERLDDFYPLPACFNWLGPQDEVNETREQQRVHRRRFNRRYVYRDGTFDPSELEKLEGGEDGVYAKHTGAPGETPLAPVPDAPQDGNSWPYLAAGKEDFMQVSGVGGDQRAVPEQTTATQASIVDTNSKIRQNAHRMAVGAWLGQIGRILLMTLREKMALPFWIKQQVDPASPNAMQEAMRIAGLWQKIQAQDLGSIDMEVAVDVEELSPVTKDAQRATWNQCLVIVTNPVVMPLLALSEVLLRRTLKLHGLEKEDDVRAIMQAVAQKATMDMEMAQQAAVGSGGAPQGSAPAQPGIPTMPGAQTGGFA